MTTTREVRIDMQVELGCLFGMVHASVVAGEMIGAHVEVDGNVIYDTELIPLRARDEVDVIRAVRNVAHIAVQRACWEIRAPFSPDDSLRLRVELAKALPFPVDF